MAGLFNTISGFKVKEYTAVQKETDSEDSTNYKDVDFSLNFSSVKTVTNSGIATTLASITNDDYKKEDNSEKSYIEDEETSDDEFKIIDKYQDDDKDNEGFNSES